jgi:hypothetical protein
MLQDTIRRTLVIAEQAGIRPILTHPIAAAPAAAASAAPGCKEDTPMSMGASRRPETIRLHPLSTGHPRSLRRRRQVGRRGRSHPGGGGPADGRTTRTQRHQSANSCLEPLREPHRLDEWLFAPRRRSAGPCASARIGAAAGSGPSSSTRQE